MERGRLSHERVRSPTSGQHGNCVVLHAGCVSACSMVGGQVNTRIVALLTLILAVPCFLFGAWLVHCARQLWRA